MDERIANHPAFIAFQKAEEKPIEEATVIEEGKDKEVKVEAE